jgi:ATP-dependent Zn protease
MYVRSMGMSEGVSVLSGDKKAFSDQQNFALDCEANRLVQESYGRVKRVMLENREAIIRLVDELVKKETLSSEEFRAILEGRDPKPDPPAQQPSDNPRLKALTAVPVKQ